MLILAVASGYVAHIILKGTKTWKSSYMKQNSWILRWQRVKWGVQALKKTRQFSKQLTLYSFSKVTLSKILSSAVISSLLKPYVSQLKLSDPSVLLVVNSSGYLHTLHIDHSVVPRLNFHLKKISSQICQLQVIDIFRFLKQEQDLFFSCLHSLFKDIMVKLKKKCDF